MATPSPSREPQLHEGSPSASPTVQAAATQPLNTGNQQAQTRRSSSRADGNNDDDDDGIGRLLQQLQDQHSHETHPFLGPYRNSTMDSDSTVPQLEHTILDTLLWMSGLAASPPPSGPSAMALLGGALASTPPSDDALGSTLPWSQDFAQQPPSASSAALLADRETELHTPLKQRTSSASRTRAPASEGSAHHDGQRRSSDSPFLASTDRRTPVSTQNAAGNGPSGLVQTARTSPSTRAISSAPLPDPGITPPSQLARSVAVAGAVGGADWQRSFAAHAQRILRETHKQVEVLREYQAKAAREAQRSAQLLSAQRGLEERLAAAEQVRVAEQRAHEHTVRELSRQVLELDGVVAALRRREAALEEERDAAQRAREECCMQYAAHEKDVVAEWATQMTALREENAAREEEWRRERGRLMDELQRQQEALLVSAREQSYAGDANTPPLRLEHATNTDAIEKSSAAPLTEAVNNMLEEGATGDTPPPLSRVHPDVMEQQRLRERTLTSQLSLLESQLQSQKEQRRLLNSHIAELMADKEALRSELLSVTAGGGARRQLSLDTTGSAVVPPHDEALFPTTESNATQTEECHTPTHQPSERVGVALTVPNVPLSQSPQDNTAAVLREIQAEYEALQRQWRVLVQQRKDEQKVSAEQWHKVHSVLGQVLDAAEIGPGSDEARGNTAKDSEGDESGLDDTASSALPQRILAALHNLHDSLKERQVRYAKALVQERETVRLATLEHALQQAERQNEAHRAALEGTERQLQEARDALVKWHARQQALELSLGQQQRAWQTAEDSVSTVRGLLRRALREYTQPLPADTLRPVPDTATTTAAATPDSSAAEESRRSPSATQKASPMSEGGSVPTREPSVSTCATTSPGDETAMPEAINRHGDAATLPCDITGGADERVTTPSPDEESVDTPGLMESVKAVKRETLALLTAWRSRQALLLENQRRWQHRCEEERKTRRTQQAKQAAQQRHWVQQVRMLRSAEKHRLEERERLQQDWAAAQEEQAEAAAELQAKMKSDAAQDREGLMQRVRAAEAEAHKAEQELVHADGQSNALRTRVQTLEDEKEGLREDVELLQRQASELTTHIEDLEGSVRAAQRLERGLHALLTVAVRALVAALLRTEQLQHKTAMVGTLWASAECTVEAIEHALHSSLKGSSVKGRHVTASSSLPLPSPTTSGSAAASPALSPPAGRPRLRTVVYVLIAGLRLAHLCKRYQRQPACAAPSPDFQRLSTFLAVLGISVPSRLTHSPCGSDRSDASRRRGLHDLPLVTLPPTMELVGTLQGQLLDLETAAAGSRSAKHGNADRRVHFARVQNGQDDGDDEEDEFWCEAQASTHRSAALLEHLLSMTMIDVEAASTRRLYERLNATSTAASSSLMLSLARQTAWRQSVLHTHRRSIHLSFAAEPDYEKLRGLLPPRISHSIRSQLAVIASQQHQLSDLEGVVQKLLEQNSKLVAAVEAQALDEESRTAELTSLTAQVELHQPREHELLALQERLVQSRASLLQERVLRRDAEQQLAYLRRQQLEATAREEQWRREVYALNMELANASRSGLQHSVLTIEKRGNEEELEEGKHYEGRAAGGVTDNQKRQTWRVTEAEVRPPFREPSHKVSVDFGERETQAARVLSPTIAAAAAQIATGGNHAEVRPDDHLVRTPPARVASAAPAPPTALLEKPSRSEKDRAVLFADGVDDRAYYQRLLRGGGGGAAAKCEGPSWQLRYEPRDNIPLMEGLRRGAGLHQRQQTGNEEFATPSVEGHPDLNLFVPAVVRQRAANQAGGNGDSSPAARATTVPAAAAAPGAEARNAQRRAHDTFLREAESASEQYAGMPTESTAHLRIVIAPRQKPPTPVAAPSQPSRRRADLPAVVPPSIMTGTASPSARSVMPHRPSWLVDAATAGERGAGQTGAIIAAASTMHDGPAAAATTVAASAVTPSVRHRHSSSPPRRAPAAEPPEATGTTWSVASVTAPASAPVVTVSAPGSSPAASSIAPYSTPQPSAPSLLVTPHTSSQPSSRVRLGDERIWGAVAGGEESVRSATQPPIVRLSASPTHPPLSPPLGNRRGGEGEESSMAQRARGPTYYTPC